MEDVRLAPIVSMGSSERESHSAGRLLPSNVRKKVEFPQAILTNYIGCRTWLKVLHRQRKMQARSEQRWQSTTI
jgi:hypothetical protein